MGDYSNKDWLDNPQFLKERCNMGNNRFCAMLDMSRNGVMLLEKVKEYIDLLSKMGYNSLMLYTEDTYEVENEPYFGYLRGRYTEKEIIELDRYAQSKGIELIPCIQTLAHLNTIFRWKKYGKLNDIRDILLVENEDTYKLIENMFLTLSKTYTTRTAVIGMDEAHLIGRGKYLDKNGLKNAYDLMLSHLKKVAEIAQKYGFETVMWSDMFVKISNNGEYYGKNILIPQERLDEIPQNVSLAYWDYYHKEKADYLEMINTHNGLQSPLWFAGGVWTFTGFTPNLQFSMQATKAAMEACREKEIQNIIMTVWGDDGRECSCFTALPILYYAIETYKGNTDLESIKAGFKEIVGIEFDVFMLLEVPNMLPNNIATTNNPSKYMLYNDLFSGIYDTLVIGNEEMYFYKAKELLKPYINKGQYCELFRLQYHLCCVLELKYTLGVELRTAYQKSDRAVLSLLVRKIRLTVSRVRAFLRQFEKVWEIEHKPQGLEVHQHRLGGLISRMSYCENALARYLKGEISEIPELGEMLLDYTGEGENYQKCVLQSNWWLENVSVNIMG